MGSLIYQDLIMLKGNSGEAFDILREEANDYNGHQEGYSGDIQGAYGFNTPRKHPRYGTKAFDKWEEKQTDTMNKGECICIEISKNSKIYKERKNNSRFKGKKGVRFFYFFGCSNY